MTGSRTLIVFGLIGAIIASAAFPQPVGIWVVAALDFFFLGFCLLMIASRRARFAFADWWCGKQISHE